MHVIDPVFLLPMSVNEHALDIVYAIQYNYKNPGKNVSLKPNKKQDKNNLHFTQIHLFLVTSNVSFVMF